MPRGALPDRDGEGRDLGGASGRGAPACVRIPGLFFRHGRSSRSDRARTRRYQQDASCRCLREEQSIKANGAQSGLIRFVQLITLGRAPAGGCSPGAGQSRM